MVDISDVTQIVRRHAEVTGVVRRRRWSDEEKGRIVAEAVAPGAVIADVARQHDLAPQHLSNWIRAAKDGQFALPADEMPAFVPVVSVESARANEQTQAGAVPKDQLDSVGTLRAEAEDHARERIALQLQRDGRACGAGEGALRKATGF